MADWSLLRNALRSVDNSVRFTWAELDDVVGGLPASATNHRAWWSGNRPHVNAWREAGFEVASLLPGREVTFVRSTSTARSPQGVTSAPAPVDASSAAGRSILLVTCVKEKLDKPARARDLYVSSLFRKERAYAESSGLPWFILSAEHGLVAPDEWLAPYERYLPDTSSAFRAAWGTWVVERLELLAGPLRGRTVEVHASSAYVHAIRGPLERKGASIAEPLAGLAIGQRLAWYAEQAPAAGHEAGDHPIDAQHDAAARFCEELSDPARAVRPQDLLDAGSHGLQVPGLYSWWVDGAGADDLSSGLDHPVSAGLVYAGLAGATRWPSGRRSTNTLWSRIAGMHLGRRHEFSTFRRTLGSVLAQARGEMTIDEAALTEWMLTHLKVVAIPFDDADSLGRLEEAVLGRLDPPLNLKGMDPTPLRRRVTELRRPHGRSSPA